MLAGIGTKFNISFLAPVAQLDRAPDYGSGGWEFDSLRVCHCKYVKFSLNKNSVAIGVLFDSLRHIISLYS